MPPGMAAPWRFHFLHFVTLAGSGVSSEQCFKEPSHTKQTKPYFESK